MKYAILGAVLVLGLGYWFFHRTHEENISVSDSSTQATTTIKTSSSTMTVPKQSQKSHVDMKPVVNPSGFNGELLALTNKERKTPLVESAVLDQRALERAKVVCTIPFTESAHNSFHTGPGTSILSDLSNGTAENLARNFDDATSTHTGFMASATHKKNIVNPIYLYMGIGHVLCPANDQGSRNVTVEFFTGQTI